MNIIVLIKQVPNTAEISIDPKTGSLIREGLESIINPDDMHALEAALLLKEKYGGGTTAISMGPPQAIDAISEAMGMGIDRGILLSDSAFAGADTWATSHTLGKAIEKAGDYDLIISGRQAIDGDTAQIGPQVAEYLGIPQITYVFEIEMAGKEKIIARRRMAGERERIECPLPALLTVLGELNTPRYPSMKKLLNACGSKANVEIWNAADIGVMTKDVGLEGSLTHVRRTFSPKFKREGEILEGDTSSVVRQLMKRIGGNLLCQKDQNRDAGETR